MQPGLVIDSARPRSNLTRMRRSARHGAYLDLNPGPGRIRKTAEIPGGIGKVFSAFLSGAAIPGSVKTWKQGNLQSVNRGMLK
jgi:hypothetical protein